MLHITADEIDRWADKRTAQSEFPWLLRRLIWASSHHGTYVDMHGGEQNHLSGFDGVVQCITGNGFVPEGTSAWELSTERTVKRKATKDFESRDADPGAFERPATAFVFATPRHWPGAANWAQECAECSAWKEVRAICSTHLEDWLDRVPWVAAEFTHHALNRPARGIRTIKMLWDEYRRVPLQEPEHLAPDFVLCGRKAETENLCIWLQDNQRRRKTTKLLAGTRQEALHFLAATAYSMPASQREKIEAQVVVFEDLAATPKLRELTSSHVLVAAGDNVLPEALRVQEDTGVRVLIVDAQPDADDKLVLPLVDGISLPQIGKDIMIRQVAEAGVPEEDAARICENAAYDYSSVRKTLFRS